MFNRIKNIFRPNKPSHEIFKGEFSNENIINYWKSYGPNLSLGITEEQLSNLETIIDFKFPPDYKEFNLLCNGFSELDMDHNHFSLWPIDRIKEDWNEKKEEDKNFIPIADYLINSHYYGYYKEKEGIYIDYGGDKIADNFKEFLELLLRDDKKMY